MMTYFHGRYNSGNDFNVGTCMTEKGTVDGRPVSFTRTNFTPHTIICNIANPLLVALDTAELQKRCYHCYRPQIDPLALPDSRGSGFDELIPCEDCEVVFFCSSSCKAMADSQCCHRYECSVYQKLAPNIPPSNLRAVLRLLLIPHGEYGGVDQRHWDSIVNCDGHVDQFREAGGKRWEDLVSLTQCAMEYSGTDQTYETVLNIFCSLLMYSVPLLTRQLEQIGLAMHPFLASISHSCDPNSIIIFDSSLHFGGSHCLEIVPLRSIGPNKRITISYFDTTAPLVVRQRELKSNFFIDCTCTKCVKEAAMPSDDPTSEEESILRRVSELMDECHTDTTRNGPVQRLRYALFLLLSKSWALSQYPTPLVLRELVKAFTNDRQYNLAFAYALLLRKANKLLMKRRSGCLHPRKLADIFVMVRLMDKIIDGEGWTFQQLSLADRGLNLVGIRAYWVEKLQRDAGRVASWGMEWPGHRYVTSIKNHDGTAGDALKDVDKRKESYRGLDELADEMLEKARRW